MDLPTLEGVIAVPVQVFCDETEPPAPGNPYGHPHSESLLRMLAEYPLLRYARRTVEWWLRKIRTSTPLPPIPVARGDPDEFIEDVVPAPGVPDLWEYLE